VLSGPIAHLEQGGEASKLKELTMHTHQQSSDPVATIGLDIGKNTFHLVGLDKRGAVAMRIKLSRPAYPPARQSATLPHRSGGRLWLALHRAKFSHTGTTFA